MSVGQAELGVSVGQGELDVGGGWDVMGLAGMGMLDWGRRGGGGWAS